MIRKQFFSNWSMLQAENGALKITIFALSAALIVSVITISNLSDKKTIVVVPPKINKEFQVSGNELSFSYFEQIGFYLSDRLLSISPESAQSSFDTILPFLTTNPNAIKSIRENLALQAKVVTENDLYQVFYPMKTMVNSKGGNFSVEGTLKKMSANNNISTAKTTINFGFVVKDGRIIINSIKVQ